MDSVRERKKERDLCVCEREKEGEGCVCGRGLLTSPRTHKLEVNIAQHQALIFITFIDSKQKERKGSP